MHRTLTSASLLVAAALLLTAAPVSAADQSGLVQASHRASTAGAFNGRDRFCDPWNLKGDLDCRDRLQQLPASPPPVEGEIVVDPPLPTGDLVWPAPPGGKYAKLRPDGRTAVAPASAPKAVKLMVRAANSLTQKPYIWGGGHARWRDRGYDCSGAVSFVLRRAGYLFWPMVSGQLAQWGSGGPGRWVSVYAHGTHVYMIIAGLRFDTSPWGDGESGPRWRKTVRQTKGFALRHPLRL